MNPVISRGFVRSDQMKTTIKVGDETVHGYWISGVYMQHKNRMLCPLGDELKPSDIDHVIIYSGDADWNMPREICMKKVIPETVCRCVYHSPKLGDIYEHDYVKFIDMSLNGNSRVSVGEIMVDNRTNSVMIRVGHQRPRSIILVDTLLEKIVGNAFENNIQTDEDPAEEKILDADILSMHFDSERGLTHYIDIMTCEGVYVSFGGLHLCGDACYRWIKKLIDIIGDHGVNNCENVAIKVKMRDNKVFAIGSVQKDIWLDLNELK